MAIAVNLTQQEHNVTFSSLVQLVISSSELNNVY